MAKSLDILALFEGHIAAGADLIAGVAGLGAGRVLGVNELGIVAESGNGLLSGEDLLADRADSALGHAGLGAGGSLCLNVNGGVIDHLGLLAGLHDLAAELADDIAGVAFLCAGCFLDVCKLIGCDVLVYLGDRCSYIFAVLHLICAADGALADAQSGMIAGCGNESIGLKFASCAGSLDNDRLIRIALNFFAAGVCADLVVNICIAVFVAVDCLTLGRDKVMTRCLYGAACSGLNLALIVDPAIGRIFTVLGAGGGFCIVTIPAAYAADVVCAGVIAVLALNSVGLAVAVALGELALLAGNNVPIMGDGFALIIGAFTFALAVGADLIAGIAGIKSHAIFNKHILTGLFIKSICHAIDGSDMGCCLRGLKFGSVRKLHFLGDRYKQSLIVSGVNSRKHGIDLADASLKRSLGAEVCSVHIFDRLICVLNKLGITAVLAEDIAPAVLNAGRLLINSEVIIIVRKRSFCLPCRLLACLCCKLLHGECLAALLAIADCQTKLAAGCLLCDKKLVRFAFSAFSPACNKAVDSYINDLSTSTANLCRNAGDLIFNVHRDDDDGFSVLMLTLRRRLLRQYSGSRQQGRDHENRHQHADKSLFHVSS